MRIDEELKNGCQRYLSELERREKIVQEQKRAEERKQEIRAKWRRLFYDDNDEIVTVIYDHK
jgi:hypothetical protein